MSERDAEFDPKVVAVIAARAGYRCSFPDCDQSTIGPGAGPTDIERIGTAAHIFAASTGQRAPRGTGGLSAEERQSAANGIWMCRDHGALIDNEKGKNYSASLLQSWKALHEERIARELRKVAVSNAGWLDRIVVEKSPLFRSGASITLGKVTLLLGKNGTGKTALCEWLAGSANFTEMLERWAGGGPKPKEVDLRLSLIKPDRREFVARFGGNALSTEYDGLRALDLNHALRVMYIRQNSSDRRAGEDDVEFLARVWGIHTYRVPQILSELHFSKYGFVKSAEIVEDTDVEFSEGRDEIELPPEITSQRAGRRSYDLYFRIGGHGAPISFRGLSGGERSHVIVSGAMVVANLLATHQSTLLILELDSQLMDDRLLSAYAEKLQGSDFRFQTLLVSPVERPKVNWGGWSMARLVGKQPDVEIEQESG